MKVRDRFDKNRIGDLVCDGAYKYVQNFAVEIDGERVAEYDRLDALVKGWEDYEEPHRYWFINSCGFIETRTEEEQPVVTDMHKKIGNYFESEEEAEKAIQKLKAHKRLKDKGFRFVDFDWKNGIIRFEELPIKVSEESDKFYEDLDLIFGGEE